MRFFCGSSYLLLPSVPISGYIREMPRPHGFKATSLADTNATHLRAMRLARLVQTLQGARIIHLLRRGKRLN